VPLGVGEGAWTFAYEPTQVTVSAGG